MKQVLSITYYPLQRLLWIGNESVTVEQFEHFPELEMPRFCTHHPIPQGMRPWVSGLGIVSNDFSANLPAYTILAEPDYDRPWVDTETPSP